MEMPWKPWEIRVPSKPLLTMAEVASYLEIGESALKDLIASGKFPHPILVSPKTPRWKSEWVGLYLEWSELATRLIAEPEKLSSGLGEFGTVSSGLDEFGADSEVSGRKRKVTPKEA